MLEDYAPTVPDWTYDQHTLEGKRKGRGIDYFRKESAKLVPPQAGGKDKYEDEAYRLWKIKEQGGATRRRAPAAAQASLPLDRKRSK